VADPSEDSPQNSDEEWDALLEKHCQEWLFPPELSQDPKDPLNTAANSLSMKRKQRLHYRVDILWTCAWNYMASAAEKMAKTGSWMHISSLDDVWCGKQENMSVLIVDPFSLLHVWTPWQALPLGLISGLSITVNLWKGWWWQSFSARRTLGARRVCDRAPTRASRLSPDAASRCTNVNKILFSWMRAQRNR
jgi:hypothetical protein